MAWLLDLARDCRRSLRLARRTPVVTSIVVAILALTIGAATAMFSLVHVFFRDLPVREPERLVQFAWQYPSDPPMNAFGWDDYTRDLEGSRTLADLIGTAPASLRGGQIVRPESKDIPGTLAAEFVTGNYFSGLGLHPTAGRLLNADDDRPGASAAAVVSSAYWQRTYGGDLRAQHATISVANVPVPIVGVLDRAFDGVIVGYQPDVWLPAGLLPREKRGLMLFARLKPGVTIAQAQSEMRVLDRVRIERLGATDPVWLSVKLNVEPARTGLAVPLTDQFARPVVALMVLVSFLMVIACANVGVLLLARGAARQHELAVCLALGASRSRLVRQALVDSGLLALCGACAGWPLAVWAAPLLLRTMIAGTNGIHGPATLDVTIDAVVLAFAAGVTGLAALLFGSAPALSARSTTPLAVIKAGASGTRARRRWSAGDLLVVVQVVLSFFLVNCLQLFVGHLSSLRGPALGFEPNPVLLLTVDTATGRPHESVLALDAEALARLASVPGVQSAALSAVIPISGAAGSRFISVDGFEEAPLARRRAWLNAVSPGYFATLGTPFMAGRDFRTADAGGERLAIVNQTLAGHYFAGQSAIGKRVTLEGDEATPFEIVGVVADAKYIDVRLPAPPTIYFDYAQGTGAPSQFSLRAGRSPSAMTAEATRILENVFGRGRVTKVTTFASQVDGSIVPERMMASLASFFGAVGALLASAGIYAVLAMAVARRTREIGLRMALGASRRSIVTTVVVRAMSLAACGIALGIPVTLWSGRFAGAMVEHLTPGGWRPLVVTAVATVIIGTVGAAVPARRATRVDPLTALRAD